MNESAMQSIFSEIKAERGRQEKLYSSRHDDQHSQSDWIAVMVRHLGLAVDDGMPGSGAVNIHTTASNPARYRRQLVRVAATAFAALEAFERQVATHQSQEKSEIGDVSGAVLDWWQSIADETGEPILVIGDESNTRYAVVESQATQTERTNCIARIPPREPVQ